MLLIQLTGALVILSIQSPLLYIVRMSPDYYKVNVRNGG